VEESNHRIPQLLRARWLDTPLCRSGAYRISNGQSGGNRRLL